MIFDEKKYVKTHPIIPDKTTKTYKIKFLTANSFMNSL